MALNRSQTRLYIAIAWGSMLGGLTFTAGTISAESSKALVATIQIALVYLLSPGLICAAGTGSLIPGACVNALLHFGIAWMVAPLLMRMSRVAFSRHYKSN